MPERTVDIKKSYGAFLDEMEKKYAPVYKPLIDHFRNLTLKQAFEALGFTARAYDRVLKVSRTIADMRGADVVEIQDISEALRYRTMN